MNIRLIEEKDKKQVFEMMKVFYNSPAILEKAPDAVLLKDIDDCISDLPFVEGFVVEEENELVGYCMIAKTYTTEFGGMCIWIEDLYFKPEHRGKGLGDKVFNHIENIYKDKIVRLGLNVVKENVNAIKSYEKNGLKVLDYLIMTKEKF